ncbi:PREDICTED: QWRF motif-containing protein 7-like isoform X2 [Brassica oleracea var. oleracea]|nr:PREDICTED: QWRF motif-containing protein 7-like isoform X2 [Brassica oleracea var. oleracea]
MINQLQKDQRSLSKKMATTTTTTSRRVRPPSPNINRSTSTTSSISLPVSLNASFSSSGSSSSSTSPSNTSKHMTISRSQSTTRSSRPNSESRGMIPARNSESRTHEVNNGRTREAFARYLEQRERGSPRSNASGKGVKPGASSPSAWALSPGRSVSTMKTSLSSSTPATSMCHTPPESPVSAAKMRTSGRGAVAGVLKYFKAQKKVSPVQEEEYHRFRLLHNRLIQLRFINARTEATMANLKVNVEDQLFWVWLRINKIRNYVVENLIEAQKLRQEIKLRQVLSLQMPLLNEWSKLDAKNLEALSKLTRKLHALSVRLPLLHGATVDVVAIHEEMVTAIEVMDEIEDIVIKFLPRVEIILYEMTELLSMFKQELSYFEELEKSLFLIPVFAAKESSLKVHILQKIEEERKSLQH